MQQVKICLKMITDFIQNACQASICLIVSSLPELKGQRVGFATVCWEQKLCATAVAMPLHLTLCHTNQIFHQLLPN